MNSFQQINDSASKIELEAWDWIVRLDGDEPLSDEEKQQLSAWVKQSPEHKKMLCKHSAFWMDDRIAQTVLSASSTSQQTTKQSFSLFGAPSFAVLTMCFVVLIAGYFIQTPASNQTQAIVSYTTNIGEYKTVSLPDGTEVILNSNSKVLVNYQDDSRNIWLAEGEAHFKVSKNHNRPFYVVAANSRVRVVGTAFTVDYSNPDNVEVEVTEGQVSLALTEPLKKIADFHNKNNTAKNTELALMSAGDFVSIDSSMAADTRASSIATSITRLSKEELQNRQAWQQGEMVFNGESLAFVISQVERYTALDIDLADQQLAELRVGGRFKINQIEFLLTSLQNNFDLEVRRLGKYKVIISRNKEK
ncbi:FecR family protein [Catenovulum agarivorans]|uniref:FecR family protein n=1 Tax=Catenovulum agarivorans TaxID=1172192 RepID=UPI0002E95E0E|nr:FecR domain-containing protein [Catenovulum agarivorans]